MKKEQSSLSIQISGESNFYLRFRCFLSAFFGVLYWIFYWKDNIFSDETMVTDNQIQKAFIQKGLLFGHIFQMGEETEALWLCGIVAGLVLFLLLAILSRNKFLFLGFMGGMTILIALRTGWVPGMTGILCLAYCLVTLFVPSSKGTILLILGVSLLFVLCFFEKTDSLKMWAGVQDIWEQWKYGGDSEVLPEGQLEKAETVKRGEKEVLSVHMAYPSVYYLRGFTGTVFEDNTWSAEAKSYSGDEMATKINKQIVNGQKTEEITQNPLQIQNTGASRRFLYLPYECLTRAGEFEESGKAVRGAGDNLYATGWTGAKDYQCISSKSLSKGLDEEEISSDCLMLTREEKKIIAELLGKKQANEEVSALSVLREVRKWMKSQLQYEDEPGRIPKGESFVSWFLEKEKKGYDVQYATAAVMFFRYYGIPSRYVEGYLVTPEALSEDNAQGMISVKEKDAHAWAEIYQEGIGWIPVEVLKEYEDKMGISYLELIDNTAVGQSMEGETEEKQEETDETSETASEPETGKDGKENTENVSETGTDSDSVYDSGADDNNVYNIEETRTFSEIEKAVFYFLVLVAVFIVVRQWLRRQRRIQEEKRWKESENYSYCVDMYYRKLYSLLALFRKEKETAEACLERLDQELDKKELEYCIKIREQAIFSCTPLTKQQRDRACDFLEKEIKNIQNALSWRRRWIWR
ncbi:MAG: transglutaminase-like domain-containing protein [Lachnospiraceae bacterium]|nr:transglutaminase-like domain-containing protein [Lachnospiraceae bacterium]